MKLGPRLSASCSCLNESTTSQIGLCSFRAIPNYILHVDDMYHWLTSQDIHDMPWLECQLSLQHPNLCTTSTSAQPPLKLLKFPSSPGTRMHNGGGSDWVAHSWKKIEKGVLKEANEKRLSKRWLWAESCKADSTIQSLVPASIIWGRPKWASSHHEVPDRLQRLPCCQASFLQNDHPEV